MIPISLTIKGLYSYQESTSIDFTKLTADGLFGIFGAIGSGKSTILEAIAFALYGKTERLNDRDNRSYNMLNLKSNELLIDFIFTCGDCDDKYKFTVTAKRNKKNFSDAGGFARKAYRWQDTWVPIDLNAESILGLSYDNFKRTIIIPQGKFQEFLELKDTARIQMLKEIFSLEKFELSPKVATLTNENNLKVSKVEGQMQGLPQFDEELLKEKEAFILAMDKLIAGQTKILEQKQKDEKELEKLKLLFEDIKAKTKSFNALKEKESEINSQDNQLSEYEKCERLFSYQIENRNNLRNSITQQQALQKDNLEEKIKLEETITKGKNIIEQTKESYEKRVELFQKAGELEKIISIKALLDDSDKLAERITKGEKTTKEEKQKLEDAKTERDTIKSAITVSEEQLPDASQLVILNKWFADKKQLDKNQKNTKEEINQLAKKLQEVKDNIHTKLKLFPEEFKLNGFPESLSLINHEVERVAAEYDSVLNLVNEEVSHLKLLAKLNDFAEDLQSGKECPLCGSTHHPHVFSAEDSSAQLQQKKVDIVLIDSKKGILNSTMISLSGAYSDYGNYNKQLKQKQKDSERVELEISNHIKAFSFTDYTINDEILVHAHLEDLEKKNAEIKRLRKQLDEKDEQLDKINENIKKYEATVEKLKKDQAEKDGQLNIFRSQIVLYKLTEEIKGSTEAISSKIDTLKNEHIQLTKDFEQAQKSLVENQKKLAGLDGRIEELEKQISSHIKQRDELQKAIDISLSREGYLSEEEVEKVLAMKTDIQQERKKIQEYKMQLHTANEQYEDVLRKVQGKKYNDEEHVLLKETVSTLSNELDDKKETLIKERHNLLQLKQQMDNRMQLQKELDKLSLRAENLKVLANLFRSSGFINYVSSVYLQNLINAANQRFHKMTRQKLMLELTADNAFQVRDFMNDGQVRSVKTLSGGQTFQAALSMALALADNIQHLTKSKQNFFFLDEGFGSLDKEALAIVFDTLKSLRKENRIVGVISHVDEMQQEIQVNLKIVNDIERGSVVTKSWS